MRVIRKLSRAIATAMFSAALGKTFDWVQSVPAGERPRYAPAARSDRAHDNDRPPQTLVGVTHRAV